MSTQTMSPSASFVKKSVSRVLEAPAAQSEKAIQHFAGKLSFETDCSDVYAAQVSGTVDFVLLDVRSPQIFTKGHVPQAVNIPVPTITEERLSEYSLDTTFVVYCAGPHCNGANKAALRIARLGRPVKEMIGGALGWVDEGFSLVAS
jgi:rhodanese-related sulfurtransferase